MIHPAAVVVFLFDAVSQAPVVVQIPPQTPDPWWKWIVQGVIPVLGGTLIAVWSFIQNRKTEQEQWNRNQNAAHEQWVLDQKKIEWREILRATSNIERTIPAVSKLQDRYDSVSKCLPKMISELLAARGGCVFIADVLDRQEVVDEFNKFVRTAALVAEFLQGFDAQIETDPAVRQSCQDKYAEVRDGYLHFCFWLKTEARKDLGAATPSS